MEHYSTIEKKETVSFAGETLELEIIVLTKIKTRVGKTGTTCFLHGWDLVNLWGKRG